MTKINTEALNALQQQEQAKRRERTGDGFNALLSQELGKTDQTESNASAAQVLGTKVYATAFIENTESSEQQVMNDIDSILGKWEEYADKLGGEDAEESLRQAYSVLSSISNDVQGVKESLENLESPELTNLINEIEVLAVTEEFKFNRGDYV